MEGKTEAIEQLRNAIERTVGKTLVTNKDFESLSNIVWSPQYQNPYYHNEGNPDSLMPTITEYFTPKISEDEDAEAMKEKLRQAQKGAYYTVMEKNDMRIVFMKDLVDTSFVFLGVYRFSPVLSDSTKIVWVRATDKCDLDNISFLNNYRN